MATITKERPKTRKRVTRRPKAAVVRRPELPEPQVSHLKVGSAAAAGQQDARQDKKRGFVSKVVHGLGALFIELGFLGPAKFSLQGSRLISPGEKTVLDAELMGLKQILPFTIPSTSALRRGVESQEVV